MTDYISLVLSTCALGCVGVLCVVLFRQRVNVSAHLEKTRQSVEDLNREIGTLRCAVSRAQDEVQSLSRRDGEIDRRLEDIRGALEARLPSLVNEQAGMINKRLTEHFERERMRLEDVRQRIEDILRRLVKERAEVQLRLDAVKDMSGKCEGAIRQMIEEQRMQIEIELPDQIKQMQAQLMETISKRLDDVVKASQQAEPTVEARQSASPSQDRPPDPTQETEAAGQGQAPPSALEAEPAGKSVDSAVSAVPRIAPIDRGG